VLLGYLAVSIPVTLVQFGRSRVAASGITGEALRSAARLVQDHESSELEAKIKKAR